MSSSSNAARPIGIKKTGLPLTGSPDCIYACQVATRWVLSCFFVKILFNVLTFRTAPTDLTSAMDIIFMDQRIR